jgi:hypothetical protein
MKKPSRSLLAAVFGACSLLVTASDGAAQYKVPPPPHLKKPVQLPLADLVCTLSMSAHADGSNPIAPGATPLYVQQGNPKDGKPQTLYVFARMENKGNVKAEKTGIRVLVQNNGAVAGTLGEMAPVVNPGSGISYKAIPFNLKPGQNQIKVTGTVDVLSAVKESNEANNSCQFNITATFKGAV